MTGINFCVSIWIAVSPTTVTTAEVQPTRDDRKALYILENAILRIVFQASAQ
jgi:hypothetical protein